MLAIIIWALILLAISRETDEKNRKYLLYFFIFVCIIILYDCGGHGYVGGRGFDG
jgi:hypothetical protein